MEQQLTVNDAINHYKFGFYTSYDADAKEIININEECGVCGEYVEIRGGFIAPYYHNDCKGKGYQR